MKNTKENKVTNLEIYEKDLKKNYAIKGAVAGVALSAIPIGIAVASNVFGVNVDMPNNWYGDFMNSIYSVIETWPGALVTSGLLAYTSVVISQDKAEEKIRKMK